MKFWLFITFTFHLAVSSAQEIPGQLEQHLEEQSRLVDTETEDDSYQQELEYFLQHPINMNNASADDLRALKMLHEVHIYNFLAYRQLFGELVPIYELQAIPGWDLLTIRKILPFISINSVEPLIEVARKRFREGAQNLLFRASQQIERSRGYNRDRSGTKYLGSPYRLMFRYQYNYKKFLRYGFVAEKDAGEQFFRGALRTGFDFYSAHLFLTRLGIVQQLALGDFTVNLGQGLIQWQSLAFGKSGEVINIKKQSPRLRPYNSIGEFHFFRGVGIRFQRKKFSLTAFFSRRKLSANVKTDTIYNETLITSFLTGGYHRTSSEIADRNRVVQGSMGGNIEFKSTSAQLGVNTVTHIFSFPIQKRNEAYNLYAIRGEHWWNSSLDYSCTFRNFHFFGELAIDRNFHRAILNGLMISVDPRVDVSLLNRSISKEYQSLYGNAFTENSIPSNEEGTFLGLAIRPFTGWKVNAYADVYKFPWLKFSADAPGRGKDFLLQISYAYGKVLEIYSRFRIESKDQDLTTEEPTNSIETIIRKNWRTQFNHKLNATTNLRARVEWIWNNHFNTKEEGFLVNADLLYKPMRKSWSGSFRVQYFETDGYDSRVYAYENDLLYSYSIPAFYGKGHRYYINLQFDLIKNLTFWIRWSQTIYLGVQSIGTGPDEIDGNKRSELKFQVRYNI